MRVMEWVDEMREIEEKRKMKMEGQLIENLENTVMRAQAETVLAAQLKRPACDSAAGRG